jgi:hypothetical protein
MAQECAGDAWVLQGELSLEPLREHKFALPSKPTPHGEPHVRCEFAAFPDLYATSVYLLHAIQLRGDKWIPL